LNCGFQSSAYFHPDKTRAQEFLLRVIASSSDRRILSVEKQLGVTPLPLSAEFSPFLIPLMVDLVGAGFASKTIERLRVGPRALKSIRVLITDDVARFAGIADGEVAAEILRRAGHLMEPSLNAATAVRYGCQQDEAAA
jgi:hypothetical protein